MFQMQIVNSTEHRKVIGMEQTLGAPKLNVTPILPSVATVTASHLSLAMSIKTTSLAWPVLGTVHVAVEELPKLVKTLSMGYLATATLFRVELTMDAGVEAKSGLIVVSASLRA